MKQSKAKIFLAGERTIDETDSFRTCSVFNSGSHYNENKKAFESVYLFNNETLGENKSISCLIKEDSTMVIIPVVGGINCKLDRSWAASVAAGEIICYGVKKESLVEFMNPFDSLVSYLLICFKAGPLKTGKKLFAKRFDISNRKNELIKLAEPSASSDPVTVPAISIGKFTGRTDHVYKPNSGNNKLFIHVIQGAFETEGRLLQEGDSLGLWNCNMVDMEALSNDAIILIIEM